MPEEQESIPEYQPTIVETHLETGEPEHWPTERMITEDNGRYAAWSTEEDLVGLGDQELQVIASLCLRPEAAPDECIPCTAYAMIQERNKERGAQPETLQEYVSEQLAEAMQTPHDTEILMGEQDIPVAERFAYRVKELGALVEEMLEGPPIPPPGVSLEELSLLTVAAQRWIKITEAQGIDMSPQQQAVLDATKATVGRLNRG